MNIKIDKAVLKDKLNNKLGINHITDDMIADLFEELGLEEIEK